MLIALLIKILIFCIIGYGIWWICTHFAMPRPILWLVGGILLIFLLVFAASQAGVSLP